MNSWLENLFGNLPARPAQPPSTGATFGAAYQGGPMSSHIDDRRQEPMDYPYLMTNQDPNNNDIYAAYPESPLGGSSRSPQSPGYDPIQQSEWGIPSDPADVAPYSPSFRPNYRPRPARLPGFGPNLPLQNWAHLPISPGDPGWTPPPSPSGPHNQQGDPTRPGYDRPSFSLNAMGAGGTTLNSIPGWGQ